MICLGIEGTAHTAGVGIVDSKGNVLSNVIDMYRPKTGGIHPREAANHHAEVLPDIISQAVSKAGISISDIDLVAFSQGPGLGPCLRTAATSARALSISKNVPLVGVNHCIAHIEIGRAMCKCSDPVLLYCSGGNTQVIAHAKGRYRVFGETQDIGIGNCLDKFARSAGLSFPGGPKIEELALKSDGLIELPYSVKGMDVAFSGLATHCESLYKQGTDLPLLCRSLQETTFAMLVEVTERAMAHVEKSEVLLGGGVACNTRLQEMAGIMAKERGAKMFVPQRDLLVDNGAMIAWLGILMYGAGMETKIDESQIMQRFRIDEVDTKWRS